MRKKRFHWASILIILTLFLIQCDNDVVYESTSITYNVLYSLNSSISNGDNINQINLYNNDTLHLDIILPIAINQTLFESVVTVTSANNNNSAIQGFIWNNPFSVSIDLQLNNNNTYYFTIDANVLAQNGYLINTNYDFYFTTSP